MTKTFAPPPRNSVSWMFDKLTRISSFPRYVRELPHFVRGAAKARTVWGDEMYVPFPEHRCIVERGLFDGEEEVLDFYMKHIKPGDVFLDLGANAGYYSLLAQHQGAEVHSFEPFPNTYRLLQKNVEMNGNKIKTYNLALSNHTGDGYMEGEGTSGYNKISDKGTTKVKTIRLDDLALVPTIIKVDVEYHDLEAMKGAEQTLRKYKPALIVECDTSMEFLKGLGYTATLLGHPKKREYLFQMR